MKRAPAGRAEDVSPCWRDALTAAELLAVDPRGLGGLRIKRAAPQAAELLLGRLRVGLAPRAPVRRLPAVIADDRLLGGLDLAATLSAGRPVHQRGLLAEADGGLLVAPGAERMTAGVAARIAGALDRGAIAAERDGFGALHPARFAVLAFDDAEADDAPPPPALTERLGLMIDLAAMRPSDLASASAPLAETEAARLRLDRVEISEEAMRALAEAAASLGITGLRPLLFARAAARAAAALAGRERTTEDDLALAARLVLGPRAVCAPAAAEEEDDGDDAPEPDQGEDGGNGADDDGSSGDPRELAERVLAAAAAALPAGLLDSGATAATSGAAGRSGVTQTSPRRGRPIGSRPGRLDDRARLDLVATLRAAAPWQKLRRREAGLAEPISETGEDAFPPPPCGEGSGVGVVQDEAESAPSLYADGPRSILNHPHPYPPHKGDGGENVAPHPARVRSRGEGPSGFPAPEPPNPPSPRILVRRDDFRILRLKERRRALTAFVVDASGSAALHRLAEAKGAVELLLAQSYVRRDEVALIAFRGAGAELLLAPTRSLARARRALSDLPGGGGTPLASGIEAAAALADRARRKGDAPTIVLLTDGAANVARDGTGGRARAVEDATAAARMVKALSLACVLIDVSPRPQDKARALAKEMAARYVALPQGDAASLARAARA